MRFPDATATTNQIQFHKRESQMQYTPFPDGFIWGAATSSYQIEGAVKEDGRGESIWDRFAATPGKIEDGTDGGNACEHYQRWPEDVALMAELGLQAYRFSVAWPRIFPAGVGAVNEAGLDFYDRLVDGLLNAGIRPAVTLYHWDLPQALEDKGGWRVRETAEAFSVYAAAVAQRLGDRVKDWITHNEPWCAAMLGHRSGEHAPGLQDGHSSLLAAHHLLLSHGLAVPLIRSASPGAQVGITLNLVDAHPASPSQADREACRHFEGSFNRWFLDPIFWGRYPEDIVEDYRSRGDLGEDGLGFVQDGDMDAISVETDFLGVNYYSRAILRSDAIPEEDNAPRTIPEPPAETLTDIGWEVYPEGLYNVLTRLKVDYDPPSICVTENGASYHTAPIAGRVPDRRRQDYLYRHFLAAHRAIGEGVPLDGYYVWSLLDNFEWAFGYTQRFGIVWVDYQTQERIPKDSALWYRDVIQQNAVFDPKESTP
jgi:beta-glucosidase